MIFIFLLILTVALITISLAKIFAEVSYRRWRHAPPPDRCLKTWPRWDANEF